MRGGLERWKRGVESRGVRHAISYALEGTCDAHLQHATGVDALEAYSAASDSTISRFIVDNGVIASDELTAGGLRVWLTGHDPITGEDRGHQRPSPDADLLLDGTLNHPKSYSIAALLHPELATEFEALQDRLRERILLTWQAELNARRGHGGLIREEITRIEVVELQHRRSRALDPHIHRHLWLNIKVLGADGKWSNLDSRVAMKLHTVVNAEGELAARTDPAWIAALARHGYTLDETGEIAELASAVRPLSRRSAQIEANRARLLAEWSAAHGGSAPSIEALQQIDRRAWAIARPTSQMISMRPPGRRTSATRSRRSPRTSRPRARRYRSMPPTCMSSIWTCSLRSRSSMQTSDPPAAADDSAASTSAPVRSARSREQASSWIVTSSTP
ncbi:relaxase domain-containing protein [Microbacterium tenebrionis]|uniref:relaxase domain-containing protein n=1 Tax=Microbacterium tenebrionis TaxID=2830665 RepID=UPI00202ACFD5|nr:relaxase domain-containing protein [Microbacterium ihumii]